MYIDTIRCDVLKKAVVVNDNNEEIKKIKKEEKKNIYINKYEWLPPHKILRKKSEYEDEIVFYEQEYVTIYTAMQLSAVL